jgi:hypothetical protein
MLATVNTTHPDYERMSDQWKNCRDTVAGSKAIKDAGVRYLPRLKDQNDEDYQAYKQRASWMGATWATIRGFKGMLLRKEPEIEAPESIQAYLKDVTMTGKSIYDLIDILTDEMLTTKRPGLLVDYPQANTQGMTAAQAEALNMRPSLAFYPAESIINWRQERINNAYVLSMVVLTEDAPLPGNEFEHNTEVHYRVLDLVNRKDDKTGETSRVYRQRVFRINDKKEDEQVGPDIYPLMNGKPLTEIPFIIDPEVDEPPLGDLVDLNLDHYRLSADLKHGLHFGGLPTAVISGYTPENAGDKLYIGSASAWVFPDPQAKASYLEFTGQGLKPISEEMTKTEERMAVVGARLLATEKKDSETAQTANIHRAGEASVLSNIGNTIGIMLSKALTIFSEWAGVDKEVTVEMNDEFLPQGIDPQQLTALVGAWQSGAISLETLFDNLQAGEIISQDVTYEMEQARIEEGAPAPPPAPVIVKKDNQTVTEEGMPV